MSTEYKTMTLDEFMTLKKSNSHLFIKSTDTKKDLGFGVTMYYYWGPSSTYYVEINQTVYFFDNHQDVDRFWKSTNTPPIGTVKIEFKSDITYAGIPGDLDYTLITHAFFDSCKMSSRRIKLLSENILSDGRVSLMYCTASGYQRYNYEFFLVIGKLVFSWFRPEFLKRLEFDINSGITQFWRPEVSGTMDYIPKYSVSDYNPKRHSKYTLPDLLVREQQLSGSIIAKVYRRVNKTVRYYLTLADKIYSFGSLEDFELIFSKLIVKDFSKIPSLNRNPDRVLVESITLITSRLERYLNADTDFSERSDIISVDKKGSIKGLKAII